MLAGYNLRQIPHHFGVQPKTDPLRCDMLRRFLFAHICRNSLFIICSLQNSSYCLLSTISGIFTINALSQQPCVPFHFDKQASFAISTPTNFCLQNHKYIYDFASYDNYMSSFQNYGSGALYLKGRNQKFTSRFKLVLLRSNL